MREDTVLVADEVWIAAALLHTEHPENEDFAVREIMDRAAQENLRGTGTLRPGVQTHVTRHCVANKRPDPGAYRILFETQRGRRRLWREGDPYHPSRARGKVVPKEGSIPERHRPLIAWYLNEYSRKSRKRTASDPILNLRGLGKEIWVAEEPDEYVRRLREGWE